MAAADLTRNLLIHYDPRADGEISVDCVAHDSGDDLIPWNFFDWKMMAGMTFAGAWNICNHQNLYSHCRETLNEAIEMTI